MGFSDRDREREREDRERLSFVLCCVYVCCADRNRGLKWTLGNQRFGFTITKFLILIFYFLLFMARK